MCKKYHKKYQILGLLFVLGECMNLFAQQPSPDNETFSIQIAHTVATSRGKRTYRIPKQRRFSFGTAR